MANLEQFGSRILGTWPAKLTFSLIVTFYLTTTENRINNLLHSSHNIALSRGIITLSKDRMIEGSFIKFPPPQCQQIKNLSRVGLKIK